MQISSKAVIAIAGATASGKSALALRLARHLQEVGTRAEILCADSVTVYKGFDIGAAKPNATERSAFPHHLLDVAEATQSFTAGDFVRMATLEIEAIHSRAAIPIVVGGTGFYLRALLRGMASNETEDWAKSNLIKNRLTDRAAVEGWQTLHQEMLRKDPGSATSVHPNDHYRIVRALQAMEIHGQPWSELNQRARAAAWRFPGTRFFCVELDREKLRENISLRTQRMMTEGLLQEVEKLLAAGIPPGAKPMLSVGYKECLDTLEGREPLASLQERIAQSTLKLAKQQRTWFRGERGVEWLRHSAWEALAEALELDQKVEAPGEENERP